PLLPWQPSSLLLELLARHPHATPGWPDWPRRRRPPGGGRRVRPGDAAILQIGSTFRRRAWKIGTPGRADLPRPGVLVGGSMADSSPYRTFRSWTSIISQSIRLFDHSS